jgi:hypothetical protein
MWDVFGAGLATCLALLAVGCGGARTYPVHGQVVFRDGKPVTGAALEIEREGEGADRINVSAPLDAEGRFALEAREGKYRALLVPVQEARGGVEGSAVVPPFSRRYMAYADSGLGFTVTSDPRKNDVKLTIEPR